MRFYIYSLLAYQNCSCEVSQCNGHNITHLNRIQQKVTKFLQKNLHALEQIFKEKEKKK